MAKAQPFSLEATYTPISKRDCSRSAFRNALTGPETCTLNAMAKARPSRPRPLMLRFLSGPVRALDILSENTDNEKVKM